MDKTEQPRWQGSARPFLGSWAISTTEVHYTLDIWLAESHTADCRGLQQTDGTQFLSAVLLLIPVEKRSIGYNLKNGLLYLIYIIIISSSKLAVFFQKCYQRRPEWGLSTAVCLLTPWGKWQPELSVVSRRDDSYIPGPRKLEKVTLHQITT